MNSNELFKYGIDVAFLEIKDAILEYNKRVSEAKGNGGSHVYIYAEMDVNPPKKRCSNSIV